MPVNSVNGTDIGGLVSGAASKRAMMSREDFLQILIAEISQQNPLDPLDNEQFLSQMVNMQNLETMSSLSDGIGSFEKFLHLGAASGLIGKTIVGVGEDGSELTGLVEKVTLDNGDVNLVIDGGEVPISAVREVLA